MALHAEGIGEAQRHLSAVGAGHFSGGDEGALGLITVPEVTLEVEHLGLGHHLQIEIAGIEPNRGTQIGAHRALGIRGHEDETAGRGRAFRGGRRVEAGAHRADVVGKDAAKLVVAHPADEAGAAAQLRNTRQGVGGGAAGGFQAGANAGVEPLGLRFIHQGHGALGEFQVVELVVVGMHEHVNDGVADADNVEGFGWGHQEGISG